MSFCRFPEDIPLYQAVRDQGEDLLDRYAELAAGLGCAGAWKATPYRRRMGEAAAPVFRAISPVQSAFCFLRQTFLHARFCLRCNWSRSAIMAMNSELVGFPLAEFTV